VSLSSNGLTLVESVINTLSYQYTCLWAKQ